MADAFTLCDKFEEKLTQCGGNLERAAVALAYGMRDDAVTAYIGMDAARQNEAAKIIALYMELGGEDTPLAVDELNEKELSHMNDVRRLIALCKTVRTACISLAAGLAVSACGAGRAQAPVLNQEPAYGAAR